MVDTRSHSMMYKVQVGEVVLNKYVDRIKAATLQTGQKQNISTKVDRVVNSAEGYSRLQRDVDRMQSWAEKWQMEFSPEKCEVI
eukprot:g45016.t1